MGNVLSGEKREQVLALGRLGWPLRRIEEATGVRRETAGDYLRKAGIVIRPPGSWGEKSLAKAATQLITGSDELSSEEKAKPATLVITGFSAQNSSPASSVEVSASACAMYREKIEADLRRGRNAMGIWQLCRSRHSCQNAEFSTMPSRGHLAREFVLQTPIVTGILRGPLN